MLANSVNQQEPNAIFRKKRGSLVQQIPSEVFEILKADWLFDGQSKVVATLRSAEFAQHLSRL